MKGAIFAAAALAGGASARRHAHAQAHELFQRAAGNDSAVCVPGCRTIWKTVVGEPTWVPAPPPPPPTATQTPAVPVPTPDVTICPTPGTYTIPAKTVIVTETQVACAAEEKQLTKGTNSYGGVVTVVDRATVVTCPYAAQETTSGVVTNIVKSTVVTCPTAGTYTVLPPTVTDCAKEVKVVYQVVKTYVPATYTAPPAIVTVTEKNVVYVCPTLAVSTVVVVEAKPTPAAEKPKEEVKVKVEVEAPKKVETSSAKVVVEGQFITYTAYFPNGNCKAQDDVTKDLKTIKGLGMDGVRIYSTDCNMIETVSTACVEVGLKMDIGVFINQPGCHNSNPDVSSQISSIRAFLSGKGKSLVRNIVVGNEAIFGGFCTPQQLKSLIIQVKTIVVETGCGASVTTVETTNIWERSDVREALVGTCDIVGLNAHAYFNAAVTASGAGKFVVGQIDYVKQLCGVSKVYVGEAGWPSAGGGNGAASASPEDQKTAIKSIIKECGNACTLFTFGREGEKDNWKGSALEASWTVPPSCFS